MTKLEWVEQLREGIRKMHSVSVEEYVRRLREEGVINEQGEVVWNLEYARQHEAEEKARHNGTTEHNADEQRLTE